MEALLVDELPSGPEWQYEPKWDGFRCLAFRDGDRVDLVSKAGKPLTRYFPDVVDVLRLKAAEKEADPAAGEAHQAAGVTGQAPGGPSRWSTERSAEWKPLKPQLVVEVQYDHFSGGRFRHGTSFLRWRPDKAPRQCTIDQVEQEGRSALKLLRSSGSSR